MKASDWISVDDDPVPVGEDVFAKDNFGDFLSGRSNGRTFYFSNCCGCRGAIETITHWMPIVPPDDRR